MIGKTISHYEILAKLGEGGMGVVYKAHDIRLRRDVAIKLLPSELSNDSERLARFYVEARAASALNHPNVGTIFDIDNAEGIHFIAMEYVQGATIRQKISSRSISVDSALNLAMQMARGLFAAHQKGIVHRDVKPENIMVTEEGLVKIMDFGLAKVIGGTNMTVAGTTMGTISYMSPEQVRGDAVDQRSDIWALGVVLFEMIAQKTPFRGEHVAAIFYEIVNRDAPRAGDFGKPIPQYVETILAKALAKDPGDRYQHLGQFISDLEAAHLKSTPTATIAVATEASKRTLAAIMFTDIVGYSALTQKNEELALELLGEHRRLLRPIFGQHSGKEVETAGDSFFVEFVSALDATKCAIQIQETLYQRNFAVAPERQILLRIGLHLGDVVHQGKHVHGDGVNIAARIEPCAEPGAICMSEDVARQIENKIQLRLLRLRRRELKNIQLPVAIYRVEMQWDRKKTRLKPPISIGTISHRNIIQASMAFGIVLVALISYYLFTQSTVVGNSIAVLPFEDLSGGRENEYFSNGVTEDVIAQLSNIAGLTVISPTSVMQFKAQNKTGREVAKELGVATLLRGSIRKDGDQIRIVVRLINASTDVNLWSESYTEQMGDFFSIQSKIATQIAHTLETRISPAEKARIEKRFTDDLEAYDFYSKGRYYWNKRMPDKLQKSIEYFKQAIQRDSNYALAYAGLADAYTIMGNFNLFPPGQTYPQARIAALKALEIDSNLAEAHAALGFALMNYDWDWVGAEREFKRGIEINSNYATVRGWLAILLTVTGRFTEATAVRKKALELDPLSSVINTDAGLTLYYSGKYDTAIDQFKKVLKNDPNFVLANIPLGGAYAQKEQYHEAIKAIQQVTIGASLASIRHPIPIAALGNAYALSGRKDDALLMLETLQELPDSQYVSPYWLGVVLAGLGKTDEALAMLENGFAEHDGSMVLLKVDPVFKKLHSHPRFKALLKRMNLE